MNKRYLDQILEKYDMVISEAAYRDLLNPPTQPFEKQFTQEPLALTAFRALELANERAPDKETNALLALYSSYFENTGLTSLAAIKERVRRASDHTGLKYLICLELMAKAYGFNTWNALFHSGRFTA